MNLLKLDEMITPKILNGLYLLTTFVAVILFIVLLLSGYVNGAITCAIIALFNRIFFECIIVIFKNNEHLKNSAENLQKIANLMERQEKRDLQNKAEKTPDADFTKD